MTSQGSALTRLHRALAARNVLLSLATAAELPRVPLAEALGICLLLRDKDPGRFELAALRWHARLCREGRLSLAEAAVALAALSALGTRRIESGAAALLAILEGHGLEDASRTLEGWMDRRLGDGAVSD
jgi:hypothetical protein